MQNGTVESIFISIDEALSKFPKMVVDEKQAEKIKNGMFLKNELEITHHLLQCLIKMIVA